MLYNTHGIVPIFHGCHGCCLLGVVVLYIPLAAPKNGPGFNPSSPIEKERFARKEERKKFHISSHPYMAVVHSHYSHGHGDAH
jgi:hypothetical protein